MILVGPDRFAELLHGFHVVDEHFRSAPPEANAPLLLGLIGIWNSNVLGFATKAVLPYAEELARFPAYLQQLDMESNGKSVRVDGSPVTLDTGPIVWGEPGTNGRSTRSTNCCTRAPASSRPTSSASPTRTTHIATTTTSSSPT